MVPKRELLTKKKHQYTVNKSSNTCNKGREVEGVYLVWKMQWTLRLIAWENNCMVDKKSCWLRWIEWNSSPSKDESPTWNKKLTGTEQKKIHKMYRTYGESEEAVARIKLSVKSLHRKSI